MPSPPLDPHHVARPARANNRTNSKAFSFRKWHHGTQVLGSFITKLANYLPPSVPSYASTKMLYEALSQSPLTKCCIKERSLKRLAAILYGCGALIYTMYITPNLKKTCTRNQHNSGKAYQDGVNEAVKRHGKRLEWIGRRRGGGGGDGRIYHETGLADLAIAEQADLEAASLTSGALRSAAAPPSSLGSRDRTAPLAMRCGGVEETGVGVWGVGAATAARRRGIAVMGWTTKEREKAAASRGSWSVGRRRWRRGKWRRGLGGVGRRTEEAWIPLQAGQGGRRWQGAMATVVGGRAMRDGVWAEWAADAEKKEWGRRRSIRATTMCLKSRRRRQGGAGGVERRAHVPAGHDGVLVPVCR
uniref:Uncharacterized protein n=1 Tax=Oryza rufipogon TaxID=4529 RepID=A0A0E0NEM6_ORYRU